MQDKLKLTIQLAGLTPKPLLAKDEEEKKLYQQAEAYVNRLWAKRSQQFAEMASEDVMAMVAFEFATYYLKAIQVEDVLDQLDKDLDKLLMNMPDSKTTVDGNPH